MQHSTPAWFYWVLLWIFVATSVVLFFMIDKATRRYLRYGEIIKKMHAALDETRADLLDARSELIECSADRARLEKEISDWEYEVQALKNKIANFQKKK